MENALAKHRGVTKASVALVNNITEVIQLFGLLL